jgi:ribonuclease-3
MSTYDRLCREIGYHFKNPDLLGEALTHRSVGSRNYERLEFLGDGALNFVIASELYQRFPEASEGDLSRLRSSLVKGDKLAELAQRYHLGEHLSLGSGELKSGGYRRASILADALEAIFGAVYLDSGFEQCRALILVVYGPSLESLPDPDQLKDPKTRLQEWLQSRKRPLPEYDVVDVSGEAHKQVFTVACKVEGLTKAVLGVGNSRRKAEQEAAQKTMRLLADEY